LTQLTTGIDVPRSQSRLRPAGQQPHFYDQMIGAPRGAANEIGKDYSAFSTRRYHANLQDVTDMRQWSLIPR